MASTLQKVATLANDTTSGAVHVVSQASPEAPPFSSKLNAKELPDDYQWGIIADANGVRPAPPATIEHAPPSRQQLPITSIGNVAGAVAEVMANVGTIKKGGWNSFHKYHYARMEDLLEVVTPLMGKQGLTVWQNEIEIKMVETRVAVTYEFIVMHKSGERLPAQRFTGVCNARDSKGGFDDKAILKCNTQARKYFLLSLFQVPAGDFEEADADDRQPETQQQRAVPGPNRSAPQETKEQGWRAPQKIGLGAGAGADQWARAFINAISHAKTAEEIRAWDALNDQALQNMSTNYPKVYDQIDASMQQMLQNLGAVDAEALMKEEDEDTMPLDPQEAMNWIATKLQGFPDYQAGEDFWNQQVAPKEKDFDATDWEMLQQEWQRFETKFPQQDPPAAA